MKNGNAYFKASGHDATAIYYPAQQGLKSCRNWISFESIDLKVDYKNQTICGYTCMSY